MEDITEKKKMLEDLLITKEKAEESDQLKTAFLHNISHEIRTPMNAIVGFSGFLANNSLHADKRKRYTDIIIQSSNQLLSIISDIVDIATVETGMEKIVEKETNLNSVCKLINEQFFSKAHEQKVGLCYKTSLPDDKATIITDPTKLMQVLSNLVGNALKFTKQGSVNFGYEVIGNNVEFYVEDTGIGIEKEMHQEIFKRFRQVETELSRQFGGSGLGLAISKEYVELLGGKIWVNSELNKGSTFHFKIPNKTSLTETYTYSSEDKDQNRTSNNNTVLIAEDEDDNFILLQEYLSEMQLNIIRAVSGVDAVSICKTNPQIQLVLMDIKMTEMDGYEAIKEITKNNPELPIITQTAYATHMDEIRARECGSTDFISKPINRHILVSKVRKHLGINL